MKNIEKGYMGFTEGMTYGMSQPNKGFRQVDWAKAKKFIEDNKDRIESVEAGLTEDWGYTSGEVWNSKEGFVPRENTYVYACSKWATPGLEIEYTDGTSETLECWEHGDDSDSYFDLN